MVNSFLVKFLAVNFSSEFNHVSEIYSLFGVSNEESFGHKRGVVVEDFWFNQFVERCFTVVIIPS